MLTTGSDCEETGTAGVSGREALEGVVVELTGALAGAFVAGVVAGPVPLLPLTGGDWPSWALVLTSPLGLVRLAFSLRTRAGEDLAAGSWRLVAACPLAAIWLALALELSAGVFVVAVGGPELLALGEPVPLDPADASASALRCDCAGAGPGAGGAPAWPEPVLPGLGGALADELACPDGAKAASKADTSTTPVSARTNVRRLGARAVIR